MTPVRLVGIGPGHPALITLQAREAITEADAVRHQDGCAPGFSATLLRVLDHYIHDPLPSPE